MSYAARESICMGSAVPNNASITMLKTALEHMSSNDYRVVIKADKRPTREHQCFNGSTFDEVAIMNEDDQFERNFLRKK